MNSVGVVGDQHQRHRREEHVVLEAHEPGRGAVAGAEIAGREDRDRRARPRRAAPGRTPTARRGAGGTAGRAGRAAAPSTCGSDRSRRTRPTASARPTSAPAGNSTRLTKRRSRGRRTSPAAPIASQARSRPPRSRAGEGPPPGRDQRMRDGLATVARTIISRAFPAARRCRARAGRCRALRRTRRAPCPRTGRTSSCAARGSRPSASAGRQFLRLVRGLDAGEHRAMPLFADVERELQQLVGAFDVLGVDDARDAQVDLREIVDA